MQITREAILKAIEPRLVDINDVRNWERMKEEKRLRQQAMYDREFALGELASVRSPMIYDATLSVSTQLEGGQGGAEGSPEQDHPLEDPVPALSEMPQLQHQ